jgi:hypothetical protein
LEPPKPYSIQRQALFVVLALALGGAAINTTIAVKTAYPPQSHPASIVRPGAEGPSARVFLEDFPNDRLPAGIGHDGQQFYAIARQPMHLNAIAPDLDRPRYRLQRMAFPLIVWILHPQGGGHGLVTATILVGALALFAGGVATGILSLQLGGSAWPALIYAFLPGAYMSMRISTADNLALAAGLGAIAFSISGRHRLAVSIGVLATLAKESTWLLLLGLALWRRDRRGACLAAVPAAVAGAWWIALRLLVKDNSAGITEFTMPLSGLWASIKYWINGNEPLAHYIVPIAFAMGIGALMCVKLRHPLGPAILLQLLLLTVLNLDVMGLDANVSRVAMPLMVLSTVAIAASLSAWERKNQDTPRDGDKT